jgi:hypothetical protein
MTTKTTTKAAKPAAKPATKPEADNAKAGLPENEAPTQGATPKSPADDQASPPALDAQTGTPPVGPTADYVEAVGFTLDENGEVVDASGQALPPVFWGEGNAAMVLQALAMACVIPVKEIVTVDPAEEQTAIGEVLRVATSDAVADVLAERARQVEAKGYSAERDDTYNSYELPRAAGCYVMNASGIPRHRALMYWPFAPDTFKPAGRRRDLVKAAALLLAEIERIDREEAGE